MFILAMAGLLGTDDGVNGKAYQFGEMLPLAKSIQMSVPFTQRKK
jgi:hypothetical protein